MPEQKMAVDRLVEVGERFSDEYNNVLRILRNQGHNDIHDLLIQHLDAPIRDMIDASIDVGADYRQALQRVGDAVEMAREVQDELKTLVPRAYQDGRMEERAANMNFITRLETAYRDAVARLRQWEAWARGESA